MTLLSDHSLRHLLLTGQLRIDPLNHDAVQPASVDLKLGDEFQPVTQPSLSPLEAIDLANIKPVESDVFKMPSGYLLSPRQFVLGTTLERIKVPSNIAGRVEGKSSLGRLGLLTHCTAGFIDPGFEGQITLELYNLSANPIILRPGLYICQVAFTFLDHPADYPYGDKALNSKYQGQTGVTASRYNS